MTKLSTVHFGRHIHAPARRFKPESRSCWTYDPATCSVHLSPRAGRGGPGSVDGSIQLAAASIPIRAQQALQALVHRLLQVVAGLAEIGIAAGHEFILRALDRLPLARALRLAHHPDMHRV